jgi:dTDP-4-amino-4,6-dideoxygalactose transaminase
VFVDIRPDTLNIDESLIEAAITPRTKVIAVVHYGGVGCEMDRIMSIAQAHRIAVVEDAAQGICATYRDRALGSFGSLAALSFHETKNITCGEGGALLVNDGQLIERAEIVREKGTNRTAFMHGAVDKYAWVDIGSSYLPGEISAGFLLAQMEEAWTITGRRLEYWNTYHEAFAADERLGRCIRPIVPAHCRHNAHMYFLVLRSSVARTRLIADLGEQGISAIFHYVPLHSSLAGAKYARTSGSMAVTDRVAAALVRLPMYIGVDSEQATVIDAVRRSIAA